jgi:hypothetical protein
MLLRAAAQSLTQLAADPYDKGDLMGSLWMLHTWTRALVYHPHVYCLVPAGGVSADRRPWQPARRPPSCLSELSPSGSADKVVGYMPNRAKLLGLSSVAGKAVQQRSRVMWQGYERQAVTITPFATEIYGEQI